ncbi:Asp-tRNA(Asn)/Glu-tRNA(Gln) amidotransferase subunit GatC [Desulfallas thermosapovorans]|uniref:Aspartyl/glutamyl-tRNA(Asn/Gln) amidotransferase subunit C n=1 Tax=Desulfallas thermosapovorans DSM 6562 TaxID=1121431 RepID=A0A5S4ZU30_9FIRM|nr:Asp-tRNA(Asn)/Glu-tRNA(Gln) amidotransferase subunit GatC [Desulfallas thermosapovorans]TYO96259.1 aspartyl/glutamyl-tRNA(Asn/Gln) amidotransferase subunit C [Desulfallas thermosapovorans DSM 6562]
MINIKDVEHVALLARLSLSEEEKMVYARQLGDILGHARKLQDLDTDNIPPTAHVLPLQNVFREDRVGEHMPVDKVLANAPDRQDNFFKVPKII